MPEMFSAYTEKLVSSLFVTVVFLIFNVLIKALFLRKITPIKRYNQASIRLRYFLITLFMICFIKIWVEGFIQILAFIGFLSAAITITQKDNLMNLIGWLVINWRGLFHEEDYIKIANHSGFVKSIGLLYFTLQENSLDFPGNITGRIVKIPNGLVARNPVMNFSQEDFIEFTLSFIFKPLGKFDLLELLFTKIKKELNDYIVCQIQLLAVNDKPSLNYEPKYFIKIRQEKPAGYEMLLLFYAKHIDKADLSYKINQMVVGFTQQHPELILAFD
ncbi:MAG: mechanosensitive ion channel [Proteobacteria bacterium]|nr:mechanosensitive ion channel [Pseudomonadota bacterium]